MAYKRIKMAKGVPINRTIKSKEVLLKGERESHNSKAERIRQITFLRYEIQKYMLENMEGPEIIKSEKRSAMEEMNRSKAAHILMINSARSGIRLKIVQD